jgi:hypothetical protein
MIRDSISDLLPKLKKHAVRLTYCLLPPESMTESMIAPADGNLYKSVVNRIYSSPNAFERIGNWKELYESHQK